MLGQWEGITGRMISHGLPIAAGLAPPVALLALCVTAGVATVLLLPSRLEAPLRKIGGVILTAAGLILAAVLIHATAGQLGTGGGGGRGGMGVYFWLFSAIALIGAVRVVTHPRPVYSALYFVLTVFASAGLFVLLWAEFMAAALILIYAGAILVTYLFVIMLAAQTQSDSLAGLAEYDRHSREPVLAASIGFLLMGVLLLLIFDRAPTGSAPSNSEAAVGTTAAVGQYLFAHQLVNLELAGLILTIAMVGAILIARRRVSDNLAVEEDAPAAMISAMAAPIDDDPHSLPVAGTRNPRQKAFPET